MEKVEKVTFSVAVMLFDMKIHSNSIPKKFCRPRSLGDLGQRSLVKCLLTFSEDFSSEASWFISIKFHMQPSGGKKTYRFGPGHIE